MYNGNNNESRISSRTQNIQFQYLVKEKIQYILEGIGLLLMAVNLIMFVIFYKYFDKNAKYQAWVPFSFSLVSFFMFTGLQVAREYNAYPVKLTPRNKLEQINFMVIYLSYLKLCFGICFFIAIIMARKDSFRITTYTLVLTILISLGSLIYSFYARRYQYGPPLYKKFEYRPAKSSIQQSNISNINNNNQPNNNTDNTHIIQSNNIQSESQQGFINENTNVVNLTQINNNNENESIVTQQQYNQQNFQDFNNNNDQQQQQEINEITNQSKQSNFFKNQLQQQSNKEKLQNQQQYFESQQSKGQLAESKYVEMNQSSENQQQFGFQQNNNDNDFSKSQQPQFQNDFNQQQQQQQWKSENVKYF